MAGIWSAGTNMGSAWVTGVCLRPNGLEWTVLRRGKESWERVSQDSLHVDESAEDRDEIIRGALKKCRGRVAVSLPFNQVLLRMVLLPSVDGEELAGMAELQIDKFSPFPEEDTATGVEVLESSEATSLTALAVVRRDAVEQAGAPFQAIGALPDAVDVEPLAWWWGLKQLPETELRGGIVALRAEGDGKVEMALIRDGKPLAFGSLPSLPPEVKTADADAYSSWIADAVEEAAYSLTTLETDWGTADMGRLLVFAAEGISTAWAAELGKELGIGEVSVRTLGECPSLSEGVARRLVDAAEPLAMDLAPDAWREEDANKRTKRRFLRAATIFIVAWLLGLGLFFTLLNVRRAQLRELETDVTQKEGPAMEVRRLRAKVLDFATYADRSHSALECLRVVSEALPAGAELTSWVYRKGVSLTLRGEAESSETIYAFTRNLEAAGLFSDVRSEGITMKTGAGGVQRYSFGVMAALPGTGAEGDAP